MQTIVQITKRGQSLGASFTKLCKQMGLKEDDFVYITVRKVEFTEEGE